MKKYYKTLSKEEKKHITSLFQEKYHNTDLMVRFKRLNIYSIISLICALVLIILSFKYEEEHISSIIIACILVASAILFLGGKYKIKINLLNKIALEQKNKN